MSDEITRYDMSIEWGSMCGCEVVYVSDGEYVRYDDYAALRAQLTTAEREREEARRALAVLAPMFDLATKEGEGMMAVGLELMRLNKELTEEREAVALFIAQNRALRTRAERAERVVEAARPWIADLWRGDLNGTAIGVCMEYEPDGQYVLWEQVAPIAEAVRALDAEAQP